MEECPQRSKAHTWSRTQCRCALPPPTGIERCGGRARTHGRRGRSPDGGGAMRSIHALPVLLALVVTSASVTRAGPYSMDRVAIGGGQTAAVAGSYSLTGGTGAVLVRSSDGGPYSLQAGFWALPTSNTTDVAPATEPLVTGRLRGGPNPFSGRAEIDFQLAVRQGMKLEVFDLRGARVRTLVDGPMDPGRYHVQWDGRDAGGASVPAGIYWLQFASGRTRERTRIVRLP